MHRVAGDRSVPKDRVYKSVRYKSQPVKKGNLFVHMVNFQNRQVFVNEMTERCKFYIVQYIICNKITLIKRVCRYSKKYSVIYLLKQLFKNFFLT